MDVDYSVQIFTPIEGYSKGSAIAKLIYSDRFDFEASVSLAEKKVKLINFNTTEKNKYSKAKCYYIRI